ncbi:hypothetical protein TWF281_004511 [Arthrobotrys megalospora]
MDNDNGPSARDRVPGSHQLSDHTHNSGRNNTPQTNASGSKAQEPLYQGQKIPELNVSFNTSGKGGGGLRSIGETFKINPSNGTLDLSIPIHTSPGRSGFGPSLALSYSSGGGNGPFGIGWHLSAGEITRKTSHRIPLYDDSDIFLLDGGEDLVPLQGKDGQPESYVSGSFLVKYFRPLVETVPMRIEQWTNVTDSMDMHWRIVSAENITTIYGLNGESRIFAGEGDKKRVYSWLQCQTYDGWGNAMEFIYKRENNAGINLRAPHEQGRGEEIRERARYLKAIKYGNLKPNRATDTEGKWAVLSLDTMEWLFQVVLDYGEHDEINPTTLEGREWIVRPDTFSRYNSGFEIREYRLCRRILMFHHMKEKLHVDDCLISSTSFTYDENPAASLITSMTYQAYRIRDGESGVQYTTQNLPPLEFSYSKVNALQNVSIKSINTSLVDQVDASQAVNSVQWVDLDGNGIPGMLLCYDNGGWFYQRNLGPMDEDKNNITDDQLGPTRVLKCQPNLRAVSFSDLDGSGNLDAICLDERNNMGGYFQRTEDDGWSDYMPFPSWPNIDSNDPQLNVDLTGDGRPDILKTEDSSNAFLWYPSLAKLGYDVGRQTWHPYQVPHLKSSDPAVGIYLTDMSGSGSGGDIVHVRNGSISYWPNLGYGRFGPEIRMSNSPTFNSETDFSQRIHFLDIDGSGTSDMIYLDPTGTAIVYYNYCGNEWSKGEESFNLDPTAIPFTLDILGNGTTALCWMNLQSVYPNKVYYIDFMGGQKPHLLTKYKNGMGCETSVKYKPSTYYFLADEIENQPWATKLPFPVQCVSETLVKDKIAMTSFVSRYRYHDGHFDAKEREFRGFGMVEEFSEEAFTMGPQKPFKRSPRNKKTWYHTGSMTLQPKLKDGEAMLKSSQIPEDLSREDEYYAFRALKGTELREEIYGQEDPKKSGSPYSVTEMRYNVRPLQSRRDKFPAVFRVESLESLTCHYEQAKEDPRISHEMTLDVDSFGNPTAELSIAYGRQQSDLANEEDKKMQEEDILEFHENKYASIIEDKAGYRASVHVSGRTSQVFGISREKGQLLDVLKLSEDRHSILRLATEYSLKDHKDGKSQTNPGVSKVLTEESRLYFKSNDMTSRLGLGEIHLFSVVDQSYILSVDSGLIQDAYGPNDEVSGYSISGILKEGGFRQLDDDDKTRWWVPSGEQKFAEDDSAESQLGGARANFYIPSIAVSALGYREKVKLDAFGLLPVEKSDNLGNSATASNDYTRLQAKEHTDQNMNRQSFALDAFGSVVGIARQGKVSEQIGDSLEGFDAILSNDDISAFIKSPTTELAAKLLGKASWRMLRNPNGYYDSSKEPGDHVMPSFEAIVFRSYHHLDTPPENQQEGVSIIISYLDGHGAEFEQVSLVKEKTESTTEVWRKSARTIRSAAGAPIRIYQPNFSSSHIFDFQSPGSIYSSTYVLDALDRTVAVINSDKTWTKTIFKTWATLEYSTASTVGISDLKSDQDIGPFIQALDEDVYSPTWFQTKSKSGEQWVRDGASKSTAYGAFPTTSHHDSEGRELLHIRQTKDGKLLKTRIKYDLMGFQSEMRDCVDRLIETRLSDYRGYLLKHGLMDKGYEWALYNIMGSPMLTWNGTGVCTRLTYDILGRLTGKDFKKGKEPAITAVKIAYGDELSVQDSVNNNLRGEITSVSDQSGRSQNLAFDFKGNCTRSSRQLAVEYRTDIDWSKSPALEPALETFTEFDALDRPVAVTNSIGNTIKKQFNKQSHVECVTWCQSPGKEWRTIVSNIEYAADGLVLKIDYGNGAHTENTYDEASRALAHRKIWRQGGAILEDASFFYDCLGKRTHEVDAAQGTAYFSNNVVKPEKDFTYDELGRLVEALGREQIYTGHGNQKGFRPPTSGFPGSSNPVPSKNCELAAYRESYEYDETDNLRSLKHHSATGAPVSGWTRSYTYNEDNILDGGKTKGNRLSETSYPGKTEKFTYDDHETDELEPMSAIDLEAQLQDTPQEYGYGHAGGIGCITSLPGYSQLGWDHENQLRSSVRQIYHEGVPQKTWYTYDYRGVRVRKVTDRAAKENELIRKLQETTYVGNHIIYQVFDGDGLHAKTRTDSSEIDDDAGRFAVVEQRSDSDPLIRFQVNSSLELDDSTAIVSYQEYSPFGTPTYAARRKQIEAPRRYRFAAYERDNETGLYHCGARYYAVWLGRWISPDPVGLEDGPNLYAYVSNDPINYRDPEGTMKGPSTGKNNVSQEDKSNVGKQGKRLEKKKKPQKKATLNEKVERTSPSNHEASGSKKGNKQRIPDSKGFGKKSTQQYQKFQEEASEKMANIRELLREKAELDNRNDCISFEVAKLRPDQNLEKVEGKLLLRVKGLPDRRPKTVGMLKSLETKHPGSLGTLQKGSKDIISLLQKVSKGRNSVREQMKKSLGVESADDIRGNESHAKFEEVLQEVRQTWVGFSEAMASAAQSLNATAKEWGQKKI